MEILNLIVLVIFIFMLFMFIKGFNQQQINKHKKHIDEQKKYNKKEIKKNE